jgi:hypothetical protein
MSKDTEYKISVSKDTFDLCELEALFREITIEEFVDSVLMAGISEAIKKAKAAREAVYSASNPREFEERINEVTNIVGEIIGYKGASRIRVVNMPSPEELENMDLNEIMAMLTGDHGQRELEMNRIKTDLSEMHGSADT